jgi:hypothetical protein
MMKIINQDIFKVLDGCVDDPDEDQALYGGQYKINYCAVVQNILSYMITSN